MKFGGGILFGIEISANARLTIWLIRLESTDRPQKIANSLLIASGDLAVNDESQRSRRYPDSRHFDRAVLREFAFEEFLDLCPPRSREFPIESDATAGIADDEFCGLNEQRPAHPAHDNQQNYGCQNLHEPYGIREMRPLSSESRKSAKRRRHDGCLGTRKSSFSLREMRW